AEFAREFPDALMAIDEFEMRADDCVRRVMALTDNLGMLPPRGFLRSRRFASSLSAAGFPATANNVFDGIPPQHPFFSLVRTVTRFTAVTDIDRSDALATLMAFAGWVHGPLAIHGDEAAFLSSLRERLASHGGEIRSERVER